MIAIGFLFVRMLSSRWIMHPTMLGRFGELPVRIDDEFVCGAVFQFTLHQDEAFLIRCLAASGTSARRSRASGRSPSARQVAATVLCGNHFRIKFVALTSALTEPSGFGPTLEPITTSSWSGTLRQPSK